jgi:PAS domain-containing protein
VEPKALADGQIQLTLLGEAVASANVGFVVWDEDRHYIAANACACELLGCTLEQLLGSVVGGHTPEGDDVVKDVLQREGGRGEIVVRRFDTGEPITVGYVTFVTRTASLPFMASVIWQIE